MTDIVYDELQNRRERQREASRRYYAKNREENHARTNKWRENNREQYNEYMRNYRKNNPEKFLSNYPETRKRYQENNREKFRDASKRWAKRNPDKANAANQARRARKLNAQGSYNSDDIILIKKLQKGRCAYCKRKLTTGFHVDHIRPLSKGGSNWPRNLQLTCITCNSKKWNLDPIDFSQKIGLLL